LNRVRPAGGLGRALEDGKGEVWCIEERGSHVAGRERRQNDSRRWSEDEGRRQRYDQSDPRPRLCGTCPSASQSATFSGAPPYSGRETALSIPIIRPNSSSIPRHVGQTSAHSARTHGYDSWPMLRCVKTTIASSRHAHAAASIFAAKIQ
jgi:hypothetical protein